MTINEPEIQEPISKCCKAEVYVALDVIESCKTNKQIFGYACCECGDFPAIVEEKQGVKLTH